VWNPPGALGHHNGEPVRLVYVASDPHYPHDQRPETVGKSTDLTPDCIVFKVPNTTAAREALEMVRESLVDPVAVGARPLIELSPTAPRPTVEFVSPAEAARRRRKGR
jgi:hypothetical protein